MPNANQVQQSILSAQLKLANLINANTTALMGGILSVEWGYIKRFNRVTKAVLRQYNLSDFTSVNFTIAYDCLLNLIGFDTTVNTIDPNFQNPAFSIGITIPFTPTILNKTQANLIDAGGGNWYLPYLDNSGVPIYNNHVPVFVTTNGVSLVFTFDTTTIIPRIYGFANNASQTITVTVI